MFGLRRASIDCPETTDLRTLISTRSPPGSEPPDWSPCVTDPISDFAMGGMN